MFGKDAMINLAVNKLIDYIKKSGKKEGGYTLEFSENEINDYLAENKHAFSILCLQDPKKGKIIKLIYSGE